MYYNCSWFHQLKLQGTIILYTPLFKEIQKQFTENLWTWKHSFMQLPIETCSSTSNSLIIIGNFWKHLTLIHIKASFFCSAVIPGYFREFIYIWNNEMKYLKDLTPQPWSIKPASILHSFGVNSCNSVGFYAKKRWFLLQECHFLYLYPLEMNFFKRFEP